MKLSQKNKNFRELTRAVNASPAIVLVRKDETQEQAWQRHVKDHPDEKFALVRVFNLHALKTSSNLSFPHPASLSIPNGSFPYVFAEPDGRLWQFIFFKSNKGYVSLL
jgi:hypothetical protein